MSNKVPEVTIYFWIIKIMATTVGETAADLLSERLGLGTTYTSLVMAVLLIIALAYQFRAKLYVPKFYWLAVVLISVVGTLISDNLVDNLGVPLWVTTTLFSVALAVTFITWYAKERTLSIHTIFTVRREAFYWLAILFTFALGTSGGDLLAERLHWGFAYSALLFASGIAIVTIAYYRFNLHPVFAFWAAYILTRPLGASMGDLLSQPTTAGGLSFGTIGTTMLFLTTILVLVVYLSISGIDQTPPVEERVRTPSAPPSLDE